jgi:Mo-dependent nitrogenase C-terminus
MNQSIEGKTMVNADVSDYTINKIILSHWINPWSKDNLKKPSPQPKRDLLQPLRQRIERLEINTPALAHRICSLIPAQCPFARKIKLFSWTILEIPPLCKLNPLYEDLMMLRFRSLSYLADECGEDISAYC